MKNNKRHTLSRGFTTAENLTIGFIVLLAFVGLYLVIQVGMRML